jgi:glutaredoxin
LILEWQVVIWSKSYCPFCKATKTLFQDLGIEVKVFELDEMDNGPDLQMALQEMTKQRTVPNVFLAGKHLGGNDDTQNAARTGKLQELLNLSK